MQSVQLEKKLWRLRNWWSYLYDTMMLGGYIKRIDPPN